jgi:hypothetical protein
MPARWHEAGCYPFDHSTCTASARAVYEFLSADWTPWQTLLRLRHDWPALVLAVEPRYGKTNGGAMPDDRAGGDASLSAIRPTGDVLWDAARALGARAVSRRVRRPDRSAARPSG